MRNLALILCSLVSGFRERSSLKPFLFQRLHASGHLCLRIKCLFVLSLLPFFLFAQNVGINATGAAPSSDAILDVSSMDKGVLIPRVDIADLSTIAPITGGATVSLLVYNTNAATGEGYYYWNGNLWVRLSTAERIDDLADGKSDSDGSHDGSSIFLGVNAGYNDDGTDNRNIGLGYQSLQYNTMGSRNIGIGYHTLLLNAVGDDNIAMGMSALFHNTEGEQNIAIGTGSLLFNTTGEANVAVGHQVLYNNSSGIWNVALGYQAAYSNNSGSYNVVVGHQAFHSNISGERNVAVGYNTLRHNATGERNVAVGSYALFLNDMGMYNTALGYGAFSEGIDYVNATALGYDAEPGASNTVRIGNASVSTIGGFANWSSVSDGRFKTEVREDVVGLDFILQLRPVTYRLDMDAIARHNKTPDDFRLLESEKLRAAEVQSGFIAQEVESAAEQVGYDFHGVDKPRTADSFYGLRYAEFVVPLVKAMQEQQEMIQALQEENNLLKQQLSVQEVQLIELAKEVNSMKAMLQEFSLSMQKTEK